MDPLSTMLSCGWPPSYRRLIERALEMRLLFPCACSFTLDTLPSSHCALSYLFMRKLGISFSCSGKKSRQLWKKSVLPLVKNKKNFIQDYCTRQCRFKNWPSFLLGICGLSTVSSTLWTVPRSPSSALPFHTLQISIRISCRHFELHVFPVLSLCFPISLPLPLISSQLLSNLQLGFCNSFHMSFSVFPTLALPLLSVMAIHTPALTPPPLSPPAFPPIQKEALHLLNSLSFYLQISCDSRRHVPFPVVMYLYHVFLGWWFL